MEIGSWFFFSFFLSVKEEDESKGVVLRGRVLDTLDCYSWTMRRLLGRQSEELHIEHGTYVKQSSDVSSGIGFKGLAKLPGSFSPCQLEVPRATATCGLDHNILHVL